MAKKKVVKKKVAKKKKAPGALAKREETALALPMGVGGAGFEEMDENDIILPRIKLLQALSPEVGEHKMTPGHFINSLTLQDYGEEIMIIAVRFYKSKILWKDRKEGGGIVCAAIDGKNPTDGPEPQSKSCAECALTQWKKGKAGAKDEPPSCNQYYNFPALILGDKTRTLVGVSLDRTKIKAAKKLLSIGMHAGDIFNVQYKLTSFLDNNGAGLQYYNINLASGGPTTPEARAHGKQMYTKLTGKKVQINAEQEEEATSEEKTNY